MRHVSRLPILAAAAILSMMSPAMAGDCTGNVVGVRPISQYNHATGSGFLAVRTGPGSKYAQIGELYANDEVSVWERSGGWLMVVCMSGRCTSPKWGEPSPRGWVSAKYVDYGGVCP